MQKKRDSGWCSNSSNVAQRGQNRNIFADHEHRSRSRRARRARRQRRQRRRCACAGLRAKVLLLRSIDRGRQRPRWARAAQANCKRQRKNTHTPGAVTPPCRREVGSTTSLVTAYSYRHKLNYRYMVDEGSGPKIVHRLTKVTTNRSTRVRTRVWPWPTAYRYSYVHIYVYMSCTIAKGV